MALVECKECKAQISSSAAACPQCGAKPKRVKWWLWVPLVLVALFFAYGLSIPTYEADARAARNVCDDMVKRGMASRYDCDRAYSEAIQRGKMGQGN